MAKTFGAAVLGTAWLAPIAAAATAVALLEVGTDRDPATVLRTSILLGLAAWFLVSILYLPFAGAKRANYRSYSLLERRIDGLCTRMDTVYREAKADGRAVCEQVKKNLADLSLQLKATGVMWVFGTGYIAAWEAVHRAEELLIEAEERDSLFEDVEHDLLRLDGSAIPHRKQLVELAKAVKGYLCREKDRDKCVDSLESARKVMREVRSNINIFRDSTWNGLVVLRNQTIKGLLLVEVCGLALLALVMVLGAAKPDDQKTHLGAAALYFIVGAAFGAFSRLYAQSKEDTSVDDYGLAAARLITIPALSGLAAVGGIVLTSLTVASAIPELATVFDVLKHPLVLVDAAAFGLAPGVLVQLLENRGKKYQEDIKSTEPTDGGTEANPSS